MKRNGLIGFLVAEALLLVVFRALQASFGGALPAVMAFPFEQIGAGLRFLSLSGDIGNAAAIALYLAVCLSPIAALLAIRKKRALNGEDGLLVLLSAVLFPVMYQMINPGMIALPMGGAMGQAFGKALLGAAIYVVLSGYAVLRILRLFSVSGMDKLFRCMSVMLSVLSVLFVYMAFGACFDSLLGAIGALKAGNTGNEHLLSASHVFLAAQFAVDALPYILNVLVVFASLKLLREMRQDRYAPETVAATKGLSRLCAAALKATVLANIGFNLLQMVFQKSLMVVNSSVEIPVFSITFVLAVLLMTRFVAENKQLKDDNDLFV